jgi:hypothetical protein
MKSGILWGFNGKSRMISRVRWSHRLPSAGIACLGLALVAFGGLTPAQAQERDQNGAQNVRYTIRDLGVVGTSPNQPGQPFVISNSGWVSGGAGVGTGEHAVLWRGGEMIDIGNPGLGGNSIAFGVNEWGLAVGEAENTSADLSTTEDFCGSGDGLFFLADAMRPVHLEARQDGSAQNAGRREWGCQSDQQLGRDRRLR